MQFLKLTLLFAFCVHLVELVTANSTAKHSGKNNKTTPSPPAAQPPHGFATNVVTNMLRELKGRAKDKDLADAISQCYNISVGQDQFINGCAFAETDLEIKIAVDTKNDPKVAPKYDMHIGQNAGNLVKLVAEMLQAKRILDMGTYTGYTAVTLAGTPHCEELITLEVEPYYESFLKERIAGTKLEKKIKIMMGLANDSLIQLKSEGKPFDLVFIDTEKNGYIQYYKYIMDNKLLSPNGVILCDNILWLAKTWNQGDPNGKALYEFAEFVKKDDRVNQMILPIRDGIYVIKPKVEAA